MKKVSAKKYYEYFDDEELYMELIKEAEEWVDKKYPCDGQAQRYVLMGVEFAYDKTKEIIKELIDDLMCMEGEEIRELKSVKEAEELLQSLNKWE